LSDATAGDVQSASAQTVKGYAAYGANRRAAIEPLVNHLAIELRDANGRLETGVPTEFELDGDDLGCGSDEKSHARTERSVLPDRATPATLTLDYYDPALDYQIGRMRASAGRNSQTGEAVGLPMVLTAQAARSLAEEGLSRRWAQRDRMTVRLPPYFLKLRTGDLIQFSGSAR
jgi:hypothetical protein